MAEVRVRVSGDPGHGGRVDHAEGAHAAHLVSVRVRFGLGLGFGSGC